ncbi:DUF998 domain-containing protein [Micromonospora radicis]|uniref:DUF998 domain-containing protein n=1 Tax=Micromonospora radicis TaxID=1894971 RepID=A0A418MZE2_9ACTN|nr:DUF998 domain-containing protein [Micromonospora radicis]
MQVSLVAGIAGTALFVLVFLLDGLTRPGYDPTRHPVSALALGRRGWIQTVNFLVSGLLVTAAGPGVAATTGSAWPAGAVTVFGLALVASGVFPMDPMRGYPPGTPDSTPETFSRPHRLHDWAGLVVFVALPAAALAAALTVDVLPWAVLSGVAAAGLVALLLWFSVAWERDSPRAGLIQRGYIVAGWAWLGALCWHLLP